MPSLVIALIGPKGSGKSTVASILHRENGFHIESFAAPIKEMIGHLLHVQGVPSSIRIAMLYGDQKEIPTPFLANRTPRHAMQTLGTEWRDLIDRNLWLNVWANRIRENYFSGATIIVDDMRFVHEAAFVRETNWPLKIIRIDRPSFGPSEHASEQEYQDIEPNLILANTGTVSDLQKAARKILET